jgi:DNA-binding IclR family transcriptional regulator
MSKIVDRTLDCFEVFADQRQPLSLTEIAKLLSIPASSCRDVLKAMQRRGYVYEVTPRGGFYPTLRMYEIGKITAEHDPVLTRAESLLRSLRDMLDESVQLAKVTDLQATYLLAFESSQPLRMITSVGTNLRSLHATSAGKALLASLDDRTLDGYLKSAELVPLTSHSIKSKKELREQLELGRKNGWFVNHEESVEGVTTLASQFRWRDSMYLVSLAGPTSRLAPKLEWAAQLLLDVCKRLEMRGPP